MLFAWASGLAGKGEREGGEGSIRSKGKRKTRRGRLERTEDDSWIE